ncbi:SDR family oxidoreductase [Chitinophaga sp. LS1]|uniref:SDR family oxidoreductase n=1 Tax=Chitinophaga sp. LS1 TaxID=3051176 RepID=UPI002AAA992F|nr:SDR family oxidoreductase [Chitinophaga sp. LS1]WPV67063.1 SDR family oxidoreductase [Chitinophaga sp. LS1]
MQTRKKVIMITGASTGIGKATAIYFAEKGWQVAATMRTVKPENTFSHHPAIKKFQLDVTDNESIQKAIGDIINDLGIIDVLFNNAGYALAGAFEATKEEQVRKQFETNLFGVMNVTRSILPYFRKERSGIILNTTSSGGIITFPLYSIYNSTKWALEGFMEALQFEVKQFNITIKNIEPAAVKSDFTHNIDFITDSNYEQYSQVVQKNTLIGYRNAPGPEVVAKIVYKAATDNKKKLRYAGTPQAKFIFFLRKLLPLSSFNKMMARMMEKPVSA